MAVCHDAEQYFCNAVITASGLACCTAVLAGLFLPVCMTVSMDLCMGLRMGVYMPVYGRSGALVFQNSTGGPGLRRSRASSTARASVALGVPARDQPRNTLQAEQ